MIKLALPVFLLFSLVPALVLTSSPAFAFEKHISDDLIYDKLKEKLAIDPDVKGGAFEIEVKGGNVILRGKVESQKRKDKATHLAKKVAGVKSVDNQIQVELK